MITESQLKHFRKKKKEEKKNKKQGMTQKRQKKLNEILVLTKDFTSYKIRYTSLGKTK